MSPTGEALVAHARTLFACLDEHSKTHATEVDGIVGALVAHLRSWRPESVCALVTLGDPEALREPRPSDVRPADALRVFAAITAVKP